MEVVFRMRNFICLLGVVGLLRNFEVFSLVFHKRIVLIDVATVYTFSGLIKSVISF